MNFSITAGFVFVFFGGRCLYIFWKKCVMKNVQNVYQTVLIK